MKIKFLISMAGHSHTWDRGQEYDVDAKEAARLVEAGYAVAVGAKPPPASKVETAAKVAPKAEARAAKPARK